ncbi:hypothetical protein SAMN04490182_2009 [Pseudomonas cedrina]|uniref:Uncharacterized protein n=2 Tax=Pseudomonas cedrina TaxID=651740 RepID=A0A1V2JZK3_PSECE|nr:STY4528 family pathogenicity island replication protein [Pseudomonas cedrina]ONH50917.1 hypothetical protein BLL36_23695 [Pseudomonas cedrina subsp. cedrina]SDS63509.1 hypothetical protein SAMN04490182_2009 [Pseudomonas cedrina]
MPRRPVEPTPRDDFIYSGQLHDCVPRALLLDRRLSPLERNAWQVIRLLLNGDGITALPTYERLRPFLTTSACAAQASCETVARALTVLRLCRWLSLARRRALGPGGQWQGNLYVLHEAPLSPSEALRLDGEYLALLGQSLSHPSKSVQWVAYDALQALAEDPLLASEVLPEPLQRLVSDLEDPQNFAISAHAQIQLPRGEPASDSEVRPASDAEISPPASDSEAGLQAPKSAGLRNPKQVPGTVLSMSKSFCIPRARDIEVPARFAALRPQEQSAALATLQRVDPGLRQAVLDEWQARCERGGVQRPSAYLFGILQKALRGDFHPWAAAPQSPPPPAKAMPRSPEQEQERVDSAQRHLAHLRKLLGIRR